MLLISIAGTFLQSFNRKLLEIIKADARERERTGETPQQQIMREKREWAIQDAQSASLKLEGNAAFSRGDYKEAFIIYSACAQNSGHEPVYGLNRAAAALKLKLFMSAEEDSTHVLELSAPTAKAYFRRGYARRCLGRLDEAAEDFLSAGCLQPGDPSVEVEVGEVARLKKLTEAELKSWVAEQGALGVEDVFVSREELQRLVDETISKASK